ncbi:DUF1236 domain-containing protein [Phreatobacter aquaticus]|uniref:DUF1236 domain-containing protein n=1 Tax=Phreatobacter aquaticus TaxID=2570229 RepID=A0A4D7QIB5_9HYPH|nr:DUF1236 domain-containing protein [Phreatobacter aquaticus]QCK85087.1 DUF1236 domain-containing protein [Phreatobacter aquaticus]
MRRSTLMAATLLGTLALPVAAYAQAQVSPGVATGATTGAVGGAIVGGPIGAVVGGVGGAVVGAIADNNRPRFREYVVTKRHPSYTYQSEVVVGAELPTAGVQYYEVPPDYGQTEYRYTIVNNRTVLVDPRTHRIVQVID